MLEDLGIKTLPRNGEPTAASVDRRKNWNSIQACFVSIAASSLSTASQRRVQDASGFVPKRMSRNSMMENSAPRQRSILVDAVPAILLLLTTRVQASDPVFTGRADPPDQFLSLWYSRPAGGWLEKENVLVLRGKAPAHVDPNYYNSPNPIAHATTDDGEGMTFECHLRATADEEGESWKKMLASPAARSRSSIPTGFTCGPPPGS